MELYESLLENQLVLSVFDKRYYTNSIIKTIKELNGKKICYVTLNKPSKMLERSFVLHGIKNDSLMFIDCVSRKLGSKANSQKTIFVESPLDFDGINEAVTKMLSDGAEVMFFDSVSTISRLGSDFRQSQKFLALVTSKIRARNRKGLFVCTKNDLESPLISHSIYYFDKKLEFSDYYKSLQNWQAARTAGSVAVVGAVFGIAFFWQDKVREPIGYVVAEYSNYSPLYAIIPFVLVAGFLLFLAGRSIKEIPEKRLMQLFSRR